MHILRNQRHPPIPSYAVLMLPFFFCISMLLAMLGTIIISVIFDIDDSHLMYWGIPIFIAVVYLMREWYARLIYCLFMFLMKRNGKHLFEVLIMRILKYSLIAFSYPPLLLVAQLVLQEPFQKPLWMALPYTYAKYILIGLIILAIIVEYITPKKLFEEAEDFYNTPAGGVIG